MFNKLHQFFSEKAVSLTLFQKVTAVIILFALIPLFIMSTLFFSSAESIIFNETVNSDNRALSQTATIINNDFISNQNALSMLVSMPEVIRILASDPKKLGVYEQAMDLRDLLGYENLVNTTKSVYRLRLFVRDELFYSFEMVNTFPLSSIENEPWFRDVQRLPYVYVPTHEQEYLLLVRKKVVTLAKGIREYTMDNKLIGVAAVDINAGWLEGILSENVTPSGNSMCIMDKGGTIIAQSGSGRALELPQDSEYMKRVTSWFSGPSGISSGRFEDWYVNWIPLEVNDWYVVELIPYSKMNHGRHTLFVQMLLVLIPVVIGIVLLSLIFSRNFSNSVKVMAHTLQRYSDGDSKARLTVTSSDVIGQLGHSINQLFDRMNTLMDERYRLGQQAKYADLNALQAQINPHFLYNTLDMLYWMAKGGEHEDLPRIIISLSGFYRKSLAQGKDEVLVQDEIEHVRYYIEIQNKRYNNAIEDSWDVDESLLGCSIMKLMLQPIVENAIQHGLMKSDRKGGELSIGIRRSGCDMVIRIQDDGTGMTQRQINDLLSGEELKKQQVTGQGYGVSNVQHRIRIYYGDRYGLSYESAVGKGTAVSITLPIREKAGQ